MALTTVQITQLKDAALLIPLDSAPEPIDSFIGRILGLSALERTILLSPDTLAEAIAELTKQREDILESKLQIPSYVIYTDSTRSTLISGLLVFLGGRGLSTQFLARLSHHSSIRATLQSIRKPHDFEVLAAAIMEGLWKFGEATRGSGDQGMDAIGLQKLISIDIAMNSGDVSSQLSFPGQHVFVFASSKVTAITKKGVPRVINPPHIRELIGGWLIQRSEQSAWKEFNVKLLSPLQMVLVTTYRLSVSSKALCRDIGIQVWGLPQLIYLICEAAPSGVFDVAGNFNSTEFGKWWRKKRATRVQPSA